MYKSTVLGKGTRPGTTEHEHKQLGAAAQGRVGCAVETGIGMVTVVTVTGTGNSTGTGSRGGGSASKPAAEAAAAAQTRE